METEEFWALVDSSRETAGGDPGQQGEALTEALSGRAAADIVSFDALFHGTRAQGYTWDLWAVGYLAAGGMGDDAFLDFRAYLIGRGKEVWQRAVQDPDSLADELDDDTGEAIGAAESLAYAASEAYEQSTGSPMPQPALRDTGPDMDSDDEADDEADDGAAAGPAGLPWDEENPQDLAQRLPRAWARWGAEARGGGA